MLRLAVLFSLVALLAATAATAATPAQYRAKVNGICRTYTPKLKKLEAKLNVTNAAPATLQGTVIALLNLGVAQDQQIEAQPVPAQLKKTMTPILARLKKIDVQAKAGITAAKAKDLATMLTHLNAISRLSTPLNHWLDAAGLRDCGSLQQ